MNYIKEINAFRNYLKTNSLEAITQALWYVIIDYHNSCNWERWIAIDNQRLMAELSISEKTLIRHRNKLIQAGLLEYKSQQRKKSSGRYKLLSFELGEVNRKDKTAGKNTADRKAVEGAEKGAVKGADGSDIYKLNKTKLNETIEEDRGTPSAAALYDDSFKSIITTYEKNIRPITPLEAERLSKWLDDMDADVIIAAIEEAIVYNKRSMKYIEGILRNWHSNNIRTKLDLEAYRRDWEDRKQSEGQASRDLNKTVDFARFEHHEYTDEQLESLFEEIG